MKKLVVILWLVIVASLSFAQTTSVSGTVQDTDGQLWIAGTWKVQFVPNPSSPNINNYYLNGSNLVQNYNSYLSQSGSLGTSATLTVTTLDNSKITPVGSQWQFTFCPNAQSKCGSLTLPTTGATFTIPTATITAAIQAPRFNAVAGAYGYNDNEAISTFPVGGTYWNTINGIQRYYTGTTWTAVSIFNGAFDASTFAGSDPGAQLTQAAATAHTWNATNGAPSFITYNPTLSSTGGPTGGTIAISSSYKILNNSVSELQGSTFRSNSSSLVGLIVGFPTAEGDAGGSIGTTLVKDFNLIELDNDFSNTYTPNTAIGISLGASLNGTPSTGFAANIHMSNCSVIGFNEAIKLGNNAFLDHWSHCLFNHNLNVINDLNIPLNTGENISFEQSMINNQYGNAFNLSDYRDELNLANTSVDDSGRGGFKGHENSSLLLTTATTTSGSSTLTAVAGLTGAVGQGEPISGTNIPAGTYAGPINTGAGTVQMRDSLGNPVTATGSGNISNLRFTFFGTDAGSNFTGLNPDVTELGGHSETYPNQQFYFGGGVGGVDQAGNPVILGPTRYASFGTHFYNNSHSLTITLTGCTVDGSGNITVSMPSPLVNNGVFSVNAGDNVLFSGFSALCGGLNNYSGVVTTKPSVADNWASMVIHSSTYSGGSISTTLDNGSVFDTATQVLQDAVIQSGSNFYYVSVVPSQNFQPGVSIVPTGLTNVPLLNGKELIFQNGLLSQAQCQISPFVPATCAAADVSSVPGIAAVALASEPLAAHLAAKPDPGMITLKDSSSGNSSIVVIGGNISGSATQQMFNLSQAHNPNIFVVGMRNQQLQYITSGITTLAGVDSFADRGALYYTSAFPATFDSQVAINSNSFGTLRLANLTTANASIIQAFQPNIATGVWTNTFVGGLDNLHGFDQYSLGFQYNNGGDNFGGLLSLNMASAPIIKWDLVNGATTFGYATTFSTLAGSGTRCAQLTSTGLLSAATGACPSASTSGSYWTLSGVNTSGTWAFTANKEVYTGYFVPYSTISNNVCIRPTTADASHNYSFALYDSTNTLVLSTGVVGGASFTPSTALKCIPLTTAATIAPGRYYASFTTDAGTAVLGTFSQSTALPLVNSTGAATTGGAPNSTITPAADNFLNFANTAPWFELTK